MKITVTILLILFLFTSCEQTTDPVKYNLADENSQLLFDVIKETVTGHNVPGAALLVRFEDGSVLKQAYGSAKIGSSGIDKMETSKLFRIGSVTKTFVGTSILILVKQGKLNLSDTVETLLPGLLKHGNELTLEMLLNQSSSIMNYTATDEFADIYYYDPTYNWTKDMIIDLYTDEELLDTPGNLSYYSNSNYYLLGLIIEKYSGKSLADFLANEIFTPLGMTNSYFATGNDLHGDYAHGYFDVNQDGNFTEDEDYTSQNHYAIWAAGGIVSTLDDLLIWSDELLSGSLLNDELQTKRLLINVPIAGAPAGVNYGLGIADLFGAVGHTGAVAGYSTILFRYRNTTIIAFGNGYETSGEKGLIAEDLFENVKTALFE